MLWRLKAAFMESVSRGIAQRAREYLKQLDLWDKKTFSPRNAGQAEERTD